MALFKEIDCVHCGKKTNMLTRSKLEDGSYVCSKCTSGIPAEIVSHLNECDYDEFQSLLEYLEESKNQLANEFRETYKFHSIHVDTQHKLFYLDKMYPTVYLKFENLTDFKMTFEAEDAKSNMLGSKVIGKVFYKVDMSFPRLFIDKVLVDNIKATTTTKVGILQNKVTYGNPKGMDDFLHHFYQAWQSAMDAHYIRLTAELQRNNYESQYHYGIIRDDE